MEANLIEVCVESLKQIRAQRHKELDVSTAAELDEVIHLLQACIKDGEDVMVDPQLSFRTLEIIDRCLSSMTNLTELMRSFFDGQ